MFRKIVLLLVLLVACLFAFAHAYFSANVGQKDFQKITEEKVSDFLRAKVKIGKMQIGFLNRVAFSGLKIESDQQEASPYDVKIEKLTFKYDLWSVLTRSFANPSTVLLETPEISLPGEIFPYGIFEQLNFGQGNNFISSLQIQDGYIRYYLPFLKANLELQQVDGSFKPTRDGVLNIDLTASLRGALSGEVHVFGTVDIKSKSHDLKLKLSSVDLGKKLSLPMKEINGDFNWVNDNVYFEGIRADIHGWKVHLNGQFLQFMSNAIFKLDWNIGKTDALSRGAVEFNLEQNKVNGDLDTPMGNIVFDGNVVRDGFVYSFSELDIGNDYVGEGVLDFDSGDYQFDFKKDRQAINVRSNLRGFDFELNLKMDHMNLYGLDLVTAAKVHLISKDPPFEKKLWKYHGTIQTDYLILEYAPLQDFKGSFQLTPYGIKDLLASWGRVFNLNGDIPFRGGGPQIQAVVRVDGFDLADIENFAAKPLPKDLGGLLEGKLKIEGSLQNPEFIGNFTVKSGKLGRLDYDLGTLQFRGFMPRLKIHDSKVIRGRTTLSLEGAFDWSMDNIFHGVEIKSSDKLAIWKGWELNTNSKKGDVEVDPKYFPRMKLKAGAESGGQWDAPREDKDKDNYIVVGPKFKF